jgi:toxin ParE1/3/4
MSRSILIVPRARHQLRGALEYLNKRNPAAAQRLAQRFHRAYRQLAEFPLSGPPAPTPGARRLAVAPYILTYRVTSTAVEILDVRHSRQRAMPLPDDL